ncbi:RecQ family ATP-dependent DNA helicase [Stieleria varia]|uniref:ATP-dependent DNA helicase RecQ n=1 Tax=Stieleria varia TaxID=2528005 RepID=A0A5C6B6B2_9BACT|nr:ATP-dependent DNA helicase RecQ [Stieleria varia]TWU07593.1 ATP-dependent DNA helicase RecQ [Stieleria varia]
MSDINDARQILRQRFGLDEFRDGQSDVISRLLQGKNVAAVFPTGGGKSLCYQLPSQLLEGTTVIVSPLIALMKDQCDALQARGIGAARLDSSLSVAEFRDAMRGVRQGEIKMLYVAPERFFNERFIASVGSLKIDLFAIDEAHCISQWGHNFRPDYLKLAELAKRLSVGRILALTATATPAVLADIQQAFDIQDDDAIRTPFHRSNLQLRSCVVNSSEHYATLKSRIESRPRGATVVYVSLQKTAEEIAERLTEDGIDAVAYHAGLESEQRAEIQQEFLSSDNGIIVATIAFGMGIDKSNIRYVYHFNPPKSLEAYAQEIGRAGRDGVDSICEILLVPDDRIVLENFTYGDTPSRESVRRFIEILSGQADSFFVSHYRLSYDTDIRILVVRTLLTYLELDGYLEAIAPRYDSYKVKPLVTSKAILANFDGERRQFVAGVLGQLTKSRTWFTLNMVAASRQLNQPRERIVKAVDFMAEQGWLEVQVSDLVHGYRWTRRIDKPAEMADQFYDQLAQRESGEIERLDAVFEIARAMSCQSAALASHFGETAAGDCGRCSACLGEGPFEIPQLPLRNLGTAVLTALTGLRQKYPQHMDSARAQARFLCGLSSPQMTRARLTRNPYYGVCSHIPFEHVLKQVAALT